MTLNGSGPMKMVIAIVRHERLQEIQDVLDVSHPLSKDALHF